MASCLSQACKRARPSYPRGQWNGSARFPKGQVPPPQQEPEQTVHDQVGEVCGSETPL